MNGRLKDRHALLTGAGGGIGLAVTRAYLSAGAHCTAVDIGAAPGAELQRLLDEHGPRLQYLRADVANVAQIPAMIRYGTASPAAWASAPPTVGPTMAPRAQPAFMTPNARPCATPWRSAASEISARPGV